jgi:hypothetical protein
LGWFALGIDQLNAPAIGVAQLDRRTAGYLDQLWTTGEGDTILAQRVMGYGGVIDLESDVVDTDDLFTSGFVNFDDRLIVARQLQFG